MSIPIIRVNTKHRINIIIKLIIDIIMYIIVHLLLKNFNEEQTFNIQVSIYVCMYIERRTNKTKVEMEKFDGSIKKHKTIRYIKVMTLGCNLKQLTYCAAVNIGLFEIAQHSYNDEIFSQYFISFLEKYKCDSVELQYLFIRN